MALWDDMTEILVGSWTGTIVLGAAALLVAPVVVPAVLTVVRLSIQGGVLVYDKTAEMITAMGEQMSDLVTEARAELTGTPAA
jgi:hypothetical protein